MHIYTWTIVPLQTYDAMSWIVYVQVEQANAFGTQNEEGERKRAVVAGLSLDFIQSGILPYCNTTHIAFAMYVCLYV